MCDDTNCALTTKASLSNIEIENTPNNIKTAEKSFHSKTAQLILMDQKYKKGGEITHTQPNKNEQNKFITISLNRYRRSNGLR